MPRSTRVVAVLLAIVGVSGEVAVLRHELVNCYPFKMMTYPPWQFYERLGNTGMLPILAALVLVTLLLARKHALATPALMTTLAPLVYLAVVAGWTTATYGTRLPAGTRNFDGYSIGEATGEFAAATLGLSCAGMVIGAACGAVLRRFERKGVNSAA